MIKFGNIVLNVGSDWLDTNVEPITPDVYRVYTSAQYGTITANPSSGLSGTEVTLSNSPHPNYQFNSYSITGSTLKSANKFDILSEDVYVVGNFDRIYNVILQQTEGGRITATPTKGINGTVITLSNSPTSTNYSFNGYTVTGATLYSGNKFNINGSDVTVRANWKYEPIPTSDQVKIGNQIWMNKNLSGYWDKNHNLIYHRSITMNGYNFGEQWYYQFAAALSIANSISGWHLPTRADWQQLFDYCGSTSSARTTKLRQTYGWPTGSNGNNSTGFSALPFGYYWTDFIYGNSDYYWVNEGSSSQPGYAINTNSTGSYNSRDMGVGMSVRLIKDS
jgi:uncharacterized protein (TIGR02145 family)